MRKHLPISPIALAVARSNSHKRNLEEGEPVTPTRKVKRKLMYERFRDLVDGMYDDSEERLIAVGAGDVKFWR